MSKRLLIPFFMHLIVSEYVYARLGLYMKLVSIYEACKYIGELLLYMRLAMFKIKTFMSELIYEFLYIDETLIKCL